MARGRRAAFAVVLLALTWGVLEGVAWLDLDQIRARADELRSPLVMRSIQDYRAGITHPLSLLADIE